MHITSTNRRKKPFFQVVLLLVKPKFNQKAVNTQKTIQFFKNKTFTSFAGFIFYSFKSVADT